MRTSGLLCLSPSASGPSTLLALILAACLPAFLLGGCTQTTSDADIRPITLAEIRKEAASKEADRLLMVDARSPKEFAAARIPDARNMHLPTVKDGRIDLDPAISKYRFLVVYGNDPGSFVARGVTKRLIQNGYSGVRLFEGGLSEWRRAGLPLEGSEPNVDTSRADKVAAPPMQMPPPPPNPAGGPR